MSRSENSISLVSPIHVAALVREERQQQTGRFGRALRADRSPLHERALFLACFALFATMAVSFLGSIL